jgi:hypothetical protein
MEQARLSFETDDNITTVDVIVDRVVVTTKKFDFSELEIYSGHRETRNRAIHKYQEEINAFQTELEVYEIPDHFFELLSVEMEDQVQLSIDELFLD